MKTSLELDPTRQLVLKLACCISVFAFEWIARAKSSLSGG